MIAELDKVQTGAVRDRFSFDGLYEVNDARNYYFWSGALVAEELRKRGASSEDIKELNLQFARHYKILRWYEEQAKRAVSLLTGKGLPPLNQENHDLHAFRTMRITGAGVRLERTNSCPALFGN